MSRPTGFPFPTISLISPGVGYYSIIRNGAVHFTLLLCAGLAGLSYSWADDAGTVVIPGPQLKTKAVLIRNKVHHVSGPASTFNPGRVNPIRYPHQRLGKPYMIKGQTYVPHHNPDYDMMGMASWYGGKFHGRLTASGEVYDKSALTAAHKTLPLNSYVIVTNLETGKSLQLRVNDRGPFARDRIIDLSEAAAISLGFRQKGVAHVRVQYAGPAPVMKKR